MKIRIKYTKKVIKYQKNAQNVEKSVKKCIKKLAYFTKCVI